jgi:hypothetical protein
MDVVCQQIVNAICQIEAQHLLHIDGVRHAFFGQAIAESPNGNKIANGYLTKLEMTSFSQKTKRVTGWDRSRRWDCDVSIAYTVVQGFTKMDEQNEEFSYSPIQAVNDLRNQFAEKYGI